MICARHILVCLLILERPLTVTTRFQSPSPDGDGDGRSSFEFYKKPAKKPQCRHHQSAIPKKSKINFICNERKCIEDRCSTQTTYIKHQNMFDNILRVNGYPEDSIDQTKHPQSHQRNSPSPNMDWSYLMIPYISSKTKLCLLRNAVYQITCNNCSQHYIGSTTISSTIV